MPTTYTNGLKLPDLGSIDWYNAYKNNIDILDPIVGTVNGVATTYATISHNHDASEITSGTIDIARLPPAALERLTTVADQTARYALTTSTVQLGDTVKQLDTGIMYLVVDTTKLNSADGYVEYSAGTASKAIADEDGTSIKTGYVNVAGDQTVSGNKTWTGVNNVTNSDFNFSQNFILGDGSFHLSRLQFYDSSATRWGVLAYRHNTDNSTEAQIGLYSLKSDNTTTSQFITFLLANNGDAELRPFFGDKKISLGTSTNQWKSVYSQSYYYNGTAWGLDKANTWTQSQTFKADTIYLSAIRRGTAPSSNVYMEFADYKDSANNRFSLIGTSYEPNKSSNCCIYAYKTTSNTGNAIGKLGIGCDASGNVYTIAPTPASSDDSTQIATTAFVKAQGYLTPSQDLIPSTTETYNLGTSTNQWKSVYAQSYYYNGTAWGLDKANVWSDTQMILSNFPKNIGIKNTSLTIGEPTPSSDKVLGTYVFKDSTDSNIGFLNFEHYKSGDVSSRWYVRYKFDNGTKSTSGSMVGVGVDVGFDNSGNKFLKAVTNADTDLGTSTNKWKTLNGLNPGALSLPDASNSVNIDTTGWVTDGSAWNTITSSNLIDGYLYINYSMCSADDYISVRLRTSNYQNPTFCVPVNTTRFGNHYLYVCVPVSKLFDVFLEIKVTGTLQKACIFPMLGNV